MSEELKACPFCGGNDIRFSLKTRGVREIKYHATMYCNDCHCYGKRTLTQSIPSSNYSGRRAIKNDKTVQELAIAAWNTRTLPEVEE